EAIELAGEAHVRLRPEPAHHLDALAHPRRALARRDSGDDTVAHVAAEADGHDDAAAPAAQVVEGGERLRHLHRIARRQDEHARSHLDALGAGGEERHQASDVETRLATHDVIRRPDRVEPEILDALGKGADLLAARDARAVDAEADANLDAAHGS